MTEQGRQAAKQRMGVKLEPGTGKAHRECGKCPVPGEPPAPQILSSHPPPASTPRLCHRGTRCCMAQELWNKLQGLFRTPAVPQQGTFPHPHTPRQLGVDSAEVEAELMPAQRECAAFCWLAQLVSQFPRMPAVCRRGWSSQAIRSKKTPLCFSII